MADAQVTLRIDLDTGDDAGAEERDEVARNLRRDLLELDVAAVDRPVVPAPDGARSGEAIALGTLLVTFGPTLLGSVCNVVEGWLARRGNRRVELELDGDRIELSGGSAEEQRRLVELFVARHQER